MKLKFRFLTGNMNNWLDYGGKWVSKRLNNGEFNCWLVLELTNMDEACGRDNIGQPRYYVTLSVVSPSEARGELNRALKSSGMLGTEHESNPLVQVESLHAYGVCAPVFQASGDNAHKLLRSARHEADLLTSFTFGFAMDRPVNRIGTTGWEALRGDLTAGLSRTIASGSTEGKILAKMHGA